MRAPLDPSLRELARELGILTEYRDGFGKLCRVSRDTVLALSKALGFPVENDRAASDARITIVRLRAQGSAPRVVVAWDGRLERLEIHTDHVLEACRVEVALERGGTLACPAEVVHSKDVAGSAGVKRLTLKVGLHLPLGYHELTLEVPGFSAQALVIAAPVRGKVPKARGFGVFAPVHALRSGDAGGRGIGTLRELARLCEHVRELGGSFVGTLPMLAGYFSEPFDSSPFAPASRLFWNELYLDLEALPELSACAEARALLHGPELTRAFAELEASPTVRHRLLVPLLERLLVPLARAWHQRGGEQEAEFQAFLREQPYAREYALFRALTDEQGAVSTWCSPRRPENLGLEHVDQSRYALHLYVQLRMAGQLRGLSSRARALSVSLYNDLPLGVHASGFDVWREPDCFLKGVNVGAPPDALCRAGQDWGFQPPHAEGQRAQRYRYFRAYLETQLRHAAMLRIDHVMGLHRVFAVPHGMPASEGAYLAQPHEELYAIVGLEAERAGALLIGEDLGAVPERVREDMERHGLRRMFVLPFEAEAAARSGLAGTIPSAALASLNTHDMPTFAGLWRGEDIAERVAREGLSADMARAAYRERQKLRRMLTGALGLSPLASREDTLRAALQALGESEVELVQVALEDLWGETQPQNIPGTFAPERNFCKRMVHTLPEVVQHPSVRALLATLGTARRARPAHASLEEV